MMLSELHQLNDGFVNKSLFMMLMAEPDPGIGGLMMRAFRAVDVLSERSLPARPKKGGFKQSLTGFREEGRPRRIVVRGCRMGASPGHLRQNIHPALSPLTHASFTAPGRRPAAKAVAL